MRTKTRRNDEPGAALDQLKSADENGAQGLKESADAAMAQAQQQAMAVTDQAKQEARDKVDEARRLIEEQSERQKEAAARYLAQVTDLVQKTSQELQAHYDQYEQQLGDYTENAANRVDQVAQRLKHGRSNAIQQATRRWVRRRPMLTLVAVLIVGILTGAFLRKSAG